MSKLTKLFKKARKAVGLPALTLGTAAKLGAAVATGGTAAAGLALGGAVVRSKLKSAAVGGAKQVLRTKASKALSKRIHGLTPPKPVASSAQTMPGGAPLKGKAPKKAAAKATTKRRKKAAPKAVKPAGTKKRAAPKGGKDFKALSASWKAAGKPGTWLAWVKSH